jgi:hypothetical protein
MTVEDLQQAHTIREGYPTAGSHQINWNQLKSLPWCDMSDLAEFAFVQTIENKQNT